MNGEKKYADVAAYYISEISIGPTDLSKLLPSYNDIDRDNGFCIVNLALKDSAGSPNDDDSINILLPHDVATALYSAFADEFPV